MQPGFSWNKEVKRKSKKSIQHQDNFLVRSSSGYSRKVRREIAEGRSAAHSGLLPSVGTDSADSEQRTQTSHSTSDMSTSGIQIVMYL